MATPVINPVTGGPFGRVGELFVHQPTASGIPTSWREVAPAFAFTVDTVTNVITMTGALPVAGDRFIAGTSGTLPAPLIDGAYYYARDVVGATCKLCMTPDGVAVDLTTAGTGTHTLSPTALPPGCELSTVNGRISGVPFYRGVYEVMLVAHNGDGDGTPYPLAIGIRRAVATLDGSILLRYDWGTGKVTPVPSSALEAIKDPDDDTKSITPLLALKNSDQRMISVEFVLGDQPFGLVVVALVAGIKKEDEEPVLARTDGSFDLKGSGPESRYVIKLDLTAAPDGGISPISVLNDQAVQGNDTVLAWMELRVSYDYERSPGVSEVLDVSSESFPVVLHRSLLAL